MASLIHKTTFLRMLHGAENQERDGSRRTVLLEVAYKLNASRVYTLCLRLLASVRAAEEATVQVFVRFSRELSKRWDESRVAARLRELAIDEALSRLRSYLSRRNVAVNSRPVQPRRSVDATPPLNSETLDDLVAQLTVDQRVAFVLHDREGLDYQAIAKHLQLEVGEVRQLVHESRIELSRLRNETTRGA